MNNVEEIRAIIAELEAIDYDGSKQLAERNALAIVIILALVFLPIFTVLGM